MKIIESYLTKNPCYIKNEKIIVKGLMLHSVGCPQPKASVFINSWNKNEYTRACVHGFIDGEDGNVYQTLPWNMRGWHAGGSANNTHIGVEMCEPSEIKYTSGSVFTCSDKAAAQTVAKRTYNSAVELFATLCKKYNLNPTASGVIVSHKEGNARGIASNHGDPEHLWAGLGLSYTMDTFRNDVKNKINSMNSVSLCVSKSNSVSYICPFKVKVSITDLNIRKGAGTSYDKTGKYTGIGVFTITEVKSGAGSVKGWGKLKSGAGWISLDYCTKL